MPWQAKSGCAEHHRPAIERMADHCPPAWLLAPRSGQVFHDLDHCNRCMRLYALAEGLDVIRKGGGSKANPADAFFAYSVGKELVTTKSSRTGYRGMNKVLSLGWLRGTNLDHHTATAPIPRVA